MPFESLTGLLRKAHAWGTRQITFLGGEPTLYPRFQEAVTAATAEGYSTRIVTNGQHCYQRVIRAVSTTNTFVCFSVDGSSETVHDGIRGAGSFAVLIDSIAKSKAAGLRTGAIVAVCRENHQDIEEILGLCDRADFEYVNVHYVTNRGFATQASVLGIDEWRNVYAVVERAAKRGRPVIRAERTFFDVPPQNFKCAVLERSNLMFLPDGRVYMCMMFIDIPDSHAFVWDGEGLRKNLSPTQEGALVMTGRSLGCPAMALVNPEVASAARNRRQFIQCIYEKEVLGGGRRSL